MVASSIVKDFINSNVESVFQRGDGFNLASVYGVNDRGLAWDLDRMDHLFQLAQGGNGAVSVSNYGDPVGLILTRERGGLDSLGSRLEANGDFVSDISGWAQVGGSTATWSSGRMVITAGGTFGGRFQDVTVPSGRTVEVSVTGRCVTAGAMLQCVVFPRTGNFNSPSSTVATFSIVGDFETRRAYVTLEPGATGVRIYLQSQTSASVGQWEIDSVSVREVPGVHLIQPTSSRRPTYARRPKSGIRNRFLNSHNASSWGISQTGTGTNVAITYPTVTIPGVGTVTALRAEKVVADGSRGPQITMLASSATINTLSLWYRLVSGTGPSSVRNSTLNANGSISVAAIVPSDGWIRISSSNWNNAATNFWLNWPSGTVGATVEIAAVQYEVGDVLTNLQQTGNQFDVTESGQPDINYLWFDGIDDCLQSATAIDFSNSDEMTVCVGARKLTGLSGVVVEHTNGSGGNDGSFALFFPLSSSASNQIQGRSRGTVQADAPVAGFTGEQLRVLTAQSKIAAPYVRVRVDAVQQAENTSSQGTGNYVSALLNIGSRNQANTFFQGHLHSGFVINRILNPLVLADYERHWVAAKAGIDLP